MSEVKISAEPRTEFGKGGARRTRRAGKVPAVLYGHGEKPRHIALPAREFAAAIRHGGNNQIFNIEISDGSAALALPKAIQKDPIKDTYEHVDLLVVRRGEKVTVEVPVRLTGEAARDTMVMTESNTLSILADATKLPEHLEASLDGLEAGSQIKASDVTLPEGTELAADPDFVIAIVQANQDQSIESDSTEEAPAETPEPAAAEA
ncbi:MULTISPECIES: 50S ribosomal protein L25/general stress protein Ctc [Dactylosporangium]|uniref:Large ribosomal subunit protein bL25 n=2 Tax=Dactylosporangium TaxID=35753 RepID=A0A9W6KPK5_9ACTN|nr:MULTISPECIES: 50S ribosomal protein L25/general stress protein Ctc [Dactylosporangium]UAB97451.1 50S ribosomal protein L25/general stress protein Ctc [Dactylosporangium vinaceum]UWZ45717.1 50S ribosomal protein L25/general stress protein Ctc [Dactylosporangium matsuzakiense]GLL04025.1 50S ribosomal protein L25 [Dactylosporangium matsuzakiense]